MDGLYLRGGNPRVSKGAKSSRHGILADGRGFPPYLPSTHSELALVFALALSTVITVFVVYDGKSIRLEGLALIGLYCIIAASFW